MEKSGKWHSVRLIATLVMVIGIVINSNAQSFFSINWEKEYDADLTQKVSSLVRSSDGNFVFAGETSLAGTPGSRILIIKFDTEGTITWQKIFGSNADYRFKSILPSKSDGFYVLGTKKSESSRPLIWLIKIDNSGNTLWETTAGGGENESMIDLAETSDNGIIICGNKEIKGDHDTDAWLIKFNKKGVQESQALFGSRYINDEFRSIAADNTNGYFIAGYSSDKIGGEIIPYIVKVDYRGNKIWEKTYPSFSRAIPGSVIVNSDGSIICLAKTFSASGEFEKLTKFLLNPSGELINNYSINRNLNISKYSFILSTDDQILMLSEPSDDASSSSGKYLIRLDNALNPVWIKPLGENDLSFNSLNQISENSFVCTGLLTTGNNKLIAKAMSFQDYSAKLLDNYINQKLASSGGMKTGETITDFRNRVGRSAYEGLIAQYSSDAKRDLMLIPESNENIGQVQVRTSVTGQIVNNPTAKPTGESGNLPISGKYYALLIAVNDYNDPNITNLDKPINDAQKLFDVLINDYLFEKINVTFLKNPTREQIISSLDKYEKELTNSDNFLLFYAGHGYWNEATQKGYWLPSDAKKQNTSNWIGNSTVSDYIRSIKAKHTLLISDACFGGSIFKTRAAFTNQDLSVIRLYDLQSRKAMTSGMLTEVPDKSVFIEYLVKRLQENQDHYLSSEQLFFSFKPSVLNNTESVPQYGVVFNAGDDGGDFIFIKKGD
jgi:hypothetical protein